MLSVEQINKLQEENKNITNENIVLLQQYQNVKEENAKLLGQLDAYKMSENEANEIIAELKAENAKLKEEITELEEKFLNLNGKSYSYYTTLQKIKKIAEYIMTSDTEKWTLDEPFKQIEKILELTKAEEE